MKEQSKKLLLIKRIILNKLTLRSRNNLIDFQKIKLGIERKHPL